jgi:Tfp pilus assembly protein PilO
MSEHLYLLSICLPLVTILVIFGMKYFSNLSQARVRILEENAYRSLAQKAVAVQSEAAASLALLQSELSEINTRLAAVEKILKAVE